MIDRLWCSTDSLKDRGQRLEKSGHNKVHCNSVDCDSGLHVLLNLNVYKWPALAEVCAHRLLQLPYYALTFDSGYGYVPLLFVCLFVYLYVCVCSRSRLPKKLWTTEWTKSCRSINGVATCRYLSAKTRFRGFQNIYISAF